MWTVLMPRRENRTSRGGLKERDRPRILVICGGARTEPGYLKGLRASRRDAAIDINVRVKARSPEQLVDYTTKIVRADFDEVWCVFDVDEFDIEAAVQAARRLRIGLAVSNPCFELWLLRHFEECRRHLANYDAVVAKLRKYQPNYDKMIADFADYAGGVVNAVSRAKKLEPTGDAHTVNPSTSVWRLIERIIPADSENLEQA
jgi:hypothetical protein